MLISIVGKYRHNNREQWVMQKLISVSRKWLILTYCCRNVSVGRVIGIHIGRVMGGREHSVVVDSESWTKTTERNSDSHLNRHRRHKRTVKGGQWEGRGVQVWDRVMLSWAHSGSAQRELSDSRHRAQVYTWSLFNFFFFFNLALTSLLTTWLQTQCTWKK